MISICFHFGHWLCSGSVLVTSKRWLFGRSFWKTVHFPKFHQDLWMCQNQSRFHGVILRNARVRRLNTTFSLVSNVSFSPPVPQIITESSVRFVPICCACCWTSSLYIRCRLLAYLGGATTGSLTLVQVLVTYLLVILQRNTDSRSSLCIQIRRRGGRTIVAGDIFVCGRFVLRDLCNLSFNFIDVESCNDSPRKVDS